MPSSDADRAKRAIRDKIWTLLEREGAAPPGAYGNIPRFVGAEQAAARLASLDSWREANVVKSNPDKAQLSVRVRALQHHKLLYMAVPRIASIRPFYCLDPRVLGQPFDVVATGKGAAAAVPTVSLEEMRPVDMVVAGSVAVNRQGVRVGKGAGYSDIEVALLTEAGLIRPDTTIVTTVHQLQVVDQELPETRHDFSVDIIVTPDEVIHCTPPRRPCGLVLEDLGEDKVQQIPILAQLLGRAG